MFAKSKSLRILNKRSKKTKRLIRQDINRTNNNELTQNTAITVIIKKIPTTKKLSGAVNKIISVKVKTNINKHTNLMINFLLVFFINIEL